MTAIQISIPESLGAYMTNEEIRLFLEEQLRRLERETIVEISAKTVSMLDSSVKNFHDGLTSETIDLEYLATLLKKIS